MRPLTRCLYDAGTAIFGRGHGKQLNIIWMDQSQTPKGWPEFREEVFGGAFTDVRTTS